MSESEPVEDDEAGRPDGAVDEETPPAKPADSDELMPAMRRMQRFNPDHWPPL
jgi:hypothetical protein